jgi:flagellar motor switch protein FliG
MPVKLTTTIKKISSIPNSINSSLLSEFCQYMESNSASESHQNNNLKALTSFAHFLGQMSAFMILNKMT